MSRLEVRIREEVKKELEKIAESQGKSVSDVIRNLINFYVNVAGVDIEKLIEEALRSPAESKYLLQIETWYRQGPSYKDERDYEVVFGDVDAIELETINEGYPYRIITKYLIIPRTIPVIIRVKEYCDIPGSERDIEEIYVFTKDGWKRIQVH